MTHTLATLFGVISVVLAIYSTYPYLRSVLHGRTKPHQFSWLIFTIMNGIVTAAQLLKGGRASVLISLTYFLSSLAIFILSFRYGTRNTSRFDKWLFGLSLATIVIWAATRDPSVAIWLTVFIDIFATTMIILKLRRHPDSEERWPWSIATTAFVFSCLSLMATPFGVLYVRPMYGLLSDGAVLLAILYYQRRIKNG